MHLLPCLPLVLIPSHHHTLHRVLRLLQIANVCQIVSMACCMSGLESVSGAILSQNESAHGSVFVICAMRLLVDDSGHTRYPLSERHVLSRTGSSD